MTRTAVIVDAVRTARGKKKGGVFNDLHPQELAAFALRSAVTRTGLDPKLIDDVILGCVTPIGEQGFNIARGAALAAGLPIEIAGVSINRFCGSGQQAVHFGAQAVMAGMMDVVFCGGIESMSRVGMGSDGAYTDDKNTKGPTSDALLERFPGLVPQGISAEMVAEKFGLSRTDCDAFAAESQRRAGVAMAEGRFKNEIAVMTLKDGRVADKDEHARPSTTAEALAALPAVFKENGCVTAGNASGIVDGASCVVVMSEEKAKALGLKPRARIKSMAVVGSEPEIMLTGPMPATRKALAMAKMSVGDVDLFEVNEAFASVPLAFMKDLGVGHEKVNVNGGAIALGHPLGATGGMLFGTLLNELERQGKQCGVVTMCIGYGMGTATVIERM
ncbi:MAG: thiolase family protein [Deltaproteobacteria bacterium]|nr:thiolase family protein [Deltaproteobacteria bacterium]